MADNCCSRELNTEGLTGFQSMEKDILKAKLAECGDNLSHLAAHLGITIPTCRKKLRAYGLWPDSKEYHDKFIKKDNSESQASQD